MTVTLVLVDDQILLRSGLKLILEGAPDMAVLAEAGDGEEAIAVVGTHDPDVVLMDIRMPGMDGIEATRRIASSGSRSRVLVLTTYDLDEHLYDAIRAGACGFLLKTAPPDQLLTTVRAAAAGDTVLAPSITRRLLERFASERGLVSAPDPGLLDSLSDRERDVLELIAKGRTNDEIASDLYVSRGTVKSHVNSLFRKLNVRDRVQAVIVAYDSGLVRPIG